MIQRVEICCVACKCCPYLLSSHLLGRFFIPSTRHPIRVISRQQTWHFLFNSWPNTWIFLRIVDCHQTWSLKPPSRSHMILQGLKIKLDPTSPMLSVQLLAFAGVYGEKQPRTNELVKSSQDSSVLSCYLMATWLYHVILFKTLLSLSFWFEASVCRVVIMSCHRNKTQVDMWWACYYE